MRHKYFLIHMNNQQLRTRTFNERKIVYESFTNWEPLNSQIRTEVVYKLQMTDLRLQDMIYQIGDYTEDEQTIFNFAEPKIRTYEFDDTA